MIEIEKAVLGTIMITTHQKSIKEQFIIDSIDDINSEWFNDKTNRIIFQAIQSLKRENAPIDLVSVRQKTTGIVDPYYLVMLTNQVTTIYNIQYQIRLLQQEYVKTELNKLCRHIAESPSVDPFEDIKTIKEGLTGLEITQEHKISNLRELVSERSNELDLKRHQEFKTVGLRSGFANLDSKIGGLVPGELIILAARPGMGKTSFAVNLAIEHCKQGGKGLIFSIEMPETQIADRVISSETQLNNSKIRNANLDDYDMNRIKSIDLPDTLLINDNSRLNIDQISNVIRKNKIKHNLTFVVIDYLQLIRSESKGNREQEVAYISSECKRIAKECQVCVMALAQLSRKVEERGDKIPLLSDLRESGSIEQDADVVLFPFRPQYYMKEQEEIEPAELHIAKCRNGQTGYIDMRFKGSTTQYLFT